MKNLNFFEKLAIYLTLNILILKGTFGFNNFDFRSCLIYTSSMQLDQFRLFIAEDKLEKAVGKNEKTRSWKIWNEIGKNEFGKLELKLEMVNYWKLYIIHYSFCHQLSFPTTCFELHVSSFIGLSDEFGSWFWWQSKIH